MRLRTLERSRIIRRIDDQPSIPRRVAAILRKYGATMLLPGVAEPVLGPELVTNGGFDTTDGWALNNGWVISGGKATKVTTGTAGNCAQSMDLSGKQLIVSFTVSGVTAGTVSAVLAQAGVGTTGQPVSANGTYSFKMSRDVVDTFRLTADASFNGSIDNVSVREILSYNDTINSFHTGNYSDSAGQTFAAVDQQVGLVMDAAGSLGSEQTANGSFAEAGTGWTNVSGFTFATGSLTISANGGGTTNNSGDAAVVGSVYYCEVVVSSLTSGAARLSMGGTNGVALNAPGTFRFYVQAVSTGKPIIYCTASGTSLVITSVSVREVTGIHALQATDGYKPLERRGLVNLLTYSNDFSNTVWDKNYVTATVQSGYYAVRETVDTLHHRVARTQPSAYSQEISSKYSFSAKVRKVGRRYIALRGNFDSITVYKHVCFDLDTASVVYASAGLTGHIAADGDAFVLSVGHTSPSSNNGLVYGVCAYTTVPTDDSIQSFAGNVANGFDLYGMALFQGTVTADQIIAAGGIPVTTSAAASSSKGAAYWQFDGIDDRLQLSAVPFQMSDDHWVVAGVTNKKPSGIGAVFSLGDTASAFSYYALRAVPVGAVIRRSDGLTVLNTENVGSMAIGESAVLALSCVSGNVKVRKNSGAWTAPVNFGSIPVTLNSGGIGCLFRQNGTAPADFHNGDINCVIFGKGAISNAELLLLEKFAAKLQGRTL